MSSSRQIGFASALCTLLVGACAAQVGDEHDAVGVDQEALQSVDAQLDTTFYGGGRMRAYHAQPIQNFALAVTNDAKIWVGGYYTSSLAGHPVESTVGRLDVNGGYDTWGTSQKIVGKNNYAMWDMLAAGNTIVLGMATTAPSQSGVVSRLLNDSSSIDPAFGTSGGEFRVSIPGHSLNWIGALADGGSGKIIVAGKAWNAGANGADTDIVTYVLRLNANGTQDNGFAIATISGDIYGLGKPIRLSMGPQQDVFMAISGTSDHVIHILNTGALDLAFGGNGNVSFVGPSQGIDDIAARPDGSVYVARGAPLDMNVILLAKNGAPNTAFGNGGVDYIDYPGFGTVYNQRLRYSAVYDRLFVGGDATLASKHGNVFVFAALRPDGQPDISFHDNGFWMTDFKTLATTQSMREMAVVGDTLLAMGQGQDATGDGALLSRYRIDHGFAGQPCNPAGGCNTVPTLLRCVTQGPAGATYKICK
jgi:hypothetical protein